jgi:hypothetical protein
MRTLVLKLGALIAPFAIVGVLAIIRAEHSTRLRDAIFNAELEGKIQTLLTADTEVIVGGDSRAERQVVPAVIESRTGRSAVNIGVNAGDLITLHNALKRYGVLGTDRALVASVSIFQVNDGSVTELSRAVVLNMTFREQVVFHWRGLPSLLYNLVAWSFPGWGREDPPAAVTAPRSDGGFTGQNGTLQPQAPINVRLDPARTNHPWYRNLSLHGARWRVFREALDRLDASQLRTYVYLPPVSPVWRAYTAGTFIDAGEREFAGMLREATRERRNIRFLDFYSTPDPRLGNDKYYDIQHLNQAGAGEFTGILMDRIGDDLRAKRMGRSGG